MKNILKISFIITLLTLANKPAFCENNILTKGKLAEMIAANINIFPESKMQGSSKEELSNQLFKILSEKGLDFFKNAKYDDPVNYEDFIKALIFISGGDLSASIESQLKYLYENGVIPPDFLVVENIRKGIKNYYEKNKTWPQKLDDAVDGIASPDNPFFTVVLPGGISDAWQKNEFYYTSPSSGITYLYEPKTGRFYAVSNVDLDFALQVLGNVEAYSPEKPTGEPENDTELVDS